MPRQPKLAAEFDATVFRDADVEEPIDIWIHRPVASLFVLLLHRTSIAPNHITVGAGFLGIIAGLCIALAGPGMMWLILVGAGLIFATTILDCCDGQLARLRGTASMAGRALDGTVDAIVVTCAQFGIGVYLIRQGFDPIYVVLLGAAATYSWRRHTEGYDFAKQLYIANTKPDFVQDSLPTLEEIDKERARLRGLGQHGLAIFLWVYKSYTRVQRTRIRENLFGIELPPMRSTQENIWYRDEFRKDMAIWKFTGNGIHISLTYVATSVAYLYPVILVYLWWVILILLNALYIAGRIGLIRGGKRLAGRLERGKS